MKKRILLIALFCPIFLLSGCLSLSDKENEDWKEDVLLTVLPEVVDFYPFINNGIPSDGMKTKEDKANYWEVIPISFIGGFNYEAGYEYRLKVQKTHLANPPEDGFRFTYELINIISKIKK